MGGKAVKRHPWSVKEAYQCLLDSTNAKKEYRNYSKGAHISQSSAVVPRKDVEGEEQSKYEQGILLWNTASSTSSSTSSGFFYFLISRVV